MITQELREAGIAVEGAPALQSLLDAAKVAAKRLDWATRIWFVITVLGQWVFAGYILAAYWVPVALGESDRWNNLFTAYNLAFMIHVGLALAIFVGGPIQLVASLRNRFPQFHRWNGRIYLFSVLVTSAAGLYLIWSHGTVGGLGVQLGTSVSALLVGVFAWQAVRCAIGKDFDAHRRWALRLFITAAAVWFYRIQLMLWLVLSGGRGMNPETFEGPALIITSFTQYLMPLVLLEFYFHVKQKGGTKNLLTIAGVLIVAALLTLLGTFLASMGMWLPEII